MKTYVVDRGVEVGFIKSGEYFVSNERRTTIKKSVYRDCEVMIDPASYAYCGLLILHYGFKIKKPYNCMLVNMNDVKVEGE